MAAVKLMYVAGPFRAENAWGVEQNVRRAEEVALQLWQAGCAVICPHTNTRFFDGALPDRVWLEGDIEILRRCDGVVMVDGWQASHGARRERHYAANEGLEVFDTVLEALLWLSLLDKAERFGVE